MKYKFIETTLELINAEGSAGAVNLRTVARKIGCSHQNLYNYFKNFDELLWECMIPSIKKLTEYTRVAVDGVCKTEDKMRRFFGSQVEFAVENPGIYRLIWLEKLNGNPPAYIADKIGFASEVFINAMDEFSGGTLEKETLVRVSDVIHSYIHGTACKLISGRVPHTAGGELNDVLVGNCIGILFSFRPAANVLPRIQEPASEKETDRY